MVRTIPLPRYNTIPHAATRLAGVQTEASPTVPDFTISSSGSSCIYLFSVLFWLLCFLFNTNYIPTAQNTQRKKELHELPNTEIVKHGTFYDSLQKEKRDPQLQSYIKGIHSFLRRAKHFFLSIKFWLQTESDIRYKIQNWIW